MLKLMVMAKVIIECTDAQVKSIANSFRNEKRKVIINRMLATDGAELIKDVEVINDEHIFEDEHNRGIYIKHYITIK